MMLRLAVNAICVIDRDAVDNCALLACLPTELSALLLLADVDSGSASSELP